MKRLFLAVGWWMAGPLCGAEAAFLGEGARVCMVPLGDGAFLNVLDVKSGRITQQALPGLGAGERVVALSGAEGDTLLVATAEAVWTWNGTRAGTRRLCTVPEGETIRDMAHDLAGRRTLVITYRVEGTQVVVGWWLKREGREGLMKVMARRVDHMEGAVFDPKGDLYFGCHGDLWHGRIELDTEDEAVLNAYRYCPLATLETSLTNSTQMGARSVAWAGPLLYVHVKRMGGSGWGDVVRLDTPAREAEKGEFDLVLDLEKRIGFYREALSSLERLAEAGGWTHLCATADGKRVHYSTSGEAGRVHWLARDGGEPAAISHVTGELK